MKRIAIVLVVMVLVAASPRAFATCSGNFTIYLAGQLPDVTFTAGAPQTITFNPWYAAFASSSGSCGIFARSTVPGVSIRGTYGCPGGGCPLYPPGQWAPVGDAYNPPFNTILHKATDIPMVFDGSTPAGARGTIEIGVNGNDFGDFDNIAIMGRMNVYVESETPPPTWFTVTSSASNIAGHYIVLDHPYLNGNPGAKLFVSHIRNPGGWVFGTSWNHPLSVLYDSLNQRWLLLNSDATNMPVGIAFGVRIDPTASTVCVPDNASGPVPAITINDLLSNNNIWATILVTPIGGEAHPVAVRYDFTRWQLLYSDGAPIQRFRCFNVKVFPFTQYIDNPASGDLSGRSNVTADWGVGVDFGGGAGHNSGSARILKFDWSESLSYRPMMVTHNFNPLNSTTVVDPRYLGFSVPPPDTAFAEWAVVHEDGAAMPGARFNVWAPCLASAWYPDSDGDGYGDASVTQVSCARPASGWVALGGDCDESRPTTHPGAPEIHDNRDNQCPGEPGYGVADEVTGNAGFFDNQNKANFCWQAQSGPVTGYNVARSRSRTFTNCDIIGTTASTCYSDPQNPSPRTAYYYLVQSTGHYGPGSWGQRSSGQERILNCP